MTNKIFFALNTGRDMYLTSMAKSFLQKYKYSCEIDYYNFNVEDKLYYDSKSHIDYKSMLESLDKYLGGDTSLSYERKNIEKLDEILNVLLNLPEYNIYCFSVYDQYLMSYLLVALKLKETYPNCKVVFGGPEIQLKDYIREFLESLDIECFTGDFESAILNFASSGEYTNKFVDLSSLDVVPTYSKHELKYLNNIIYVNSCRSCLNNCYYCSSSSLGEFTYVPRTMLVDWFKHYNDLGVESVRITDATLNFKDFDILLDGLIEIDNKINIQRVDANFNTLTSEQVGKLSKAGIQDLAFGIECIHPELAKICNKTHKTPQETWNLLKELELAGVNVKLFYIVGLPGQTKEIFDEELEYLMQIDNHFRNIDFELYDYFVSAKSYFDTNYESVNFYLDGSECKNLPDKVADKVSKIIVNKHIPNTHPEWLEICKSKLKNKVDMLF